MPYEEIHTACTTLFFKGQTVEIRALGKRGTASGYYDDFERLARDVHTLNQSGEYAGIYVTLNPVNPDLLARRANRIETRLGKSEATTTDGDITRRVWLPVDIDPVRPSGVSSSDTEHGAARVKAYHIASYLSDIGWPDPVVADSGNGAHLLYRIDLPNTGEIRDLVKGVLGTLDILFTDPVCQVDTANFNAARIWKLYGTTSRKGDNTSSRPHRESVILSVPDEIRMVQEDQLAHLAGMLPKEPEKLTGKDRKLGEPIDLAGWLDRNGLGYEQKPYSGGSQRWPELRERFEGTIEERMKLLKKRRGCGEGASEASDRPDAGRYQVSSRMVDQAVVKREAYRVIHEGDPLGYMLATFALDHIGDPVVAECLVMSLASRSVINAKGLHVSVTGESGKGKSHTFDTMMQQVPEDLRLEGRMSDKALFYIKGMKPGTVIALDDVSLSDQMQEVLKGVTTSFKRPFKYRTVNKDRGGETCIIPERCVWWVAKVEGTGDDQVWNRMLTCWIDDSEEQDAKVLAQTLKEAATVPAEAPGIRPEVAICQEIWRSLPPVHVVVPYAERIRFSSSMNRRNPDMLLDLVKCHAVLMQHQRERIQAWNMPCITATIDDFRQACRLYTALNGKSGGQQTKLTKKESELIEAIRSRGQGEITISEMQHITGWSNSVIRKMLHGTSSHGYNYTGLLEKCPAISVCDRTLVTDESGTYAAHRREKAYSWDQYVYESWKSDGGCWLDGHEDDRDDDSDGGGMAEDSGEMAEFSTTNRSEERGVEEEDLSNNTILAVPGGKCENVQQGNSDQNQGKDPIHDPDFSATMNLISQSGQPETAETESGPVSLSGKIRPPTALPLDLPPGNPVSAMTDSPISTENRISLREIRAPDFIEIERGYGAGPCDCCGYKWVSYQERMTRDRMHHAPRPNRKICRRCFEQANQAETDEIYALPGILNIARMERIYKDLGRCQICNRGKAVWSDPEDHVHICESCYHRNAGASAAAVS